MKFISISKKTKRGNIYRTRATKLANGYSQVVSDRDRRKNNHFRFEVEKSKILNKLAVYGTCDTLARLFRLNCTKPVIVHHPTDIGYTKSVLVLNAYGKMKLESLRYEKEKSI